MYTSYLELQNWMDLNISVHFGHITLFYKQGNPFAHMRFASNYAARKAFGHFKTHGLPTLKKDQEIFQMDLAWAKINPFYAPQKWHNRQDRKAYKKI
jgi:hypothetical protein